MTYINFERDLIIGEDGEIDVSVFLTDKGFKDISFNKDKLWDIRGRSPLTGLLTDFEVKTDIYCKNKETDTGNMAIEIRSRKKPSGISITEAKWWIHVFTIENDVKFMLMFRVDKLRKAVKYMYLNDLAHKVNGGDDNTSELLLVPISTLILLNKKF